MKLTEHFTLEELTTSDYAVRHGIANVPSEQIVTSLRVLASGLEQVRALLGHPMVVSSGYRCPMLNRAVGGSTTSDHMIGLAADFVCPGFGTPLEIARAIEASDIAFGQLIQEGTWVHISFSPFERRTVLTAHFSNGRASYSPGLG